MVCQTLRETHPGSKHHAAGEAVTTVGQQGTAGPGQNPHPERHRAGRGDPADRLRQPVERHVELVVARHRLWIERVVHQVKNAATRILLRERLHPFRHLAGRGTTVPTCWGERQWKVFLNNEDQILAAIK